MIRYIPIHDLCGFILPRNDAGVLALLRAYFDKSGTSPLGITSVAGYVAPVNEWEIVEAKWLEALNYWGIGCFHYSQLRFLVGSERAGMCANYFTRIIEDSNLDAIGAAIVDVDWRHDNWGQMTTQKLNSPYEQCLDLALDVLWQHAGENFPGEDIGVFCDADAPNESIEKVFGRHRDEHECFDTIAIGTTAKHVLLQCADLGAGKLRKSWLDIFENKGSKFPWGGLPVGRKTKTSFWSLRQGAILNRAIQIRKRKSNPIS